MAPHGGVQTVRAPAQLRRGTRHSGPRSALQAWQSAARERSAYRKGCAGIIFPCGGGGSGTSSPPPHPAGSGQRGAPARRVGVQGRREAGAGVHAGCEQRGRARNSLNVQALRGTPLLQPSLPRPQPATALEGGLGLRTRARGARGARTAGCSRLGSCSCFRSPHAIVPMPGGRRRPEANALFDRTSCEAGQHS